MKRKKPLTSGNQCITKFFKTAEIQTARTNSPIKIYPLTRSSSTSSLCSTPVRSKAKAPALCGTPDSLPTPRKYNVCDSPLTVDLTLDSSNSDSDIVVEKVVSSQGKGSVETDSTSDIEVIIDTPTQAKKRIKLDEEIDVLVNKSKLSEGSQESLGSQSWVTDVKITDVKSVTDLNLASTPSPNPRVLDSEFALDTIKAKDNSATCEKEFSESVIDGEVKTEIGLTCSDPIAVIKCEDTNHTDLNDNFLETSYLNVKGETESENMRGYGGKWDDQSRNYPNQCDGFNQRGGFQRGGRSYNQGWSNRGRRPFPDEQQGQDGFDYRSRGMFFEGQHHDGFDSRRHQNNESCWKSGPRGNHSSGGPGRNHQSGSYWESDSRHHNRSGTSNSHQRGLHHSQSYDHSSRHRNKSDNYWSRDDRVAGSRSDEKHGRGKRWFSCGDERQHGDDRQSHHGDDRHGHHRDSRHNDHENERHIHHGDDTHNLHRDDRHADDGPSQRKHHENKGDEKCETKKQSVEAVNDSNETDIAKLDSKSPSVTAPDKEPLLPTAKVEEASESPVKKGISNLKKLFASSPKASLLPSVDDSRSKPSSPSVSEMVGGQSPGCSSWLVVDECEATPEKTKMETPDSETQNMASDLPGQIRKLKVEDSGSPKSRSLPYREETSFEKLLASCGVDKSFAAATGTPDDEFNVGSMTKAPESMKVEGNTETNGEEEEDFLLLDSSDESDDDLMRPSAVALVKSLEDACKPLPHVREVPEKDDIKVEPSMSAPSRKSAAESTSNFTWSLEKLLEEKREKESDRGREMSAMEAELKQGLKNGGIDCMELDESSQDIGATDFEADQQECLERLLYIESIQTHHPGEIVFHSNKCHQIFTFPGNMTLSSCGFTIAKSKIDNHLIRFDKIGKLLEFVKSNLIDMCFKNISSQDAFLTWVFYTMSIVDNTYAVEDLYNLLYIVWNKKNSVNWVPTVKDIAKVFVNYGADLAMLVPTTLTVDFTEDELKSSEGKENERKSKKIVVDNRTGYGRSNLLHVIQAVTLAVQKRPHSYTSNDLCTLFVMMSKVALDKSLTIGQLKFDIRLCFSAILNAFPNEEWHQRVTELCCYLSTLISHHHNKVTLVRLIHNSDPRGVFLQRRLAYTMLHQLFNTTEEQNITEMKVQMLHNFTISLCRDPVDDYYLLSSIIILLDQCVGKETLPSSDKPALHTLHEHMRHLMGTIRDTIHNMDCTKVKNMLVQVDAKWNFMLQGMGTKQATLFHWTNMVSTVSTHQVEQPMEDVPCSQSDDEETPSETKT
ncbi:SMC5-SMC6 complex localization factor protein 2-like isoform X2 [Lineus longissimus]|uniref:SMC5-SMC6 complex localization factor protein 2-like isoform X2 n=1 Tax=Lineus longissimus TaxID=88925 RepID=UPI002B4E01FE